MLYTYATGSTLVVRNPKFVHLGVVGGALPSPTAVHPCLHVTQSVCRFVCLWPVFCLHGVTVLSFRSCPICLYLLIYLGMQDAEWLILDFGRAFLHHAVPCVIRIDKIGKFTKIYS